MSIYNRFTILEVFGILHAFVDQWESGSLLTIIYIKIIIINIEEYNKNKSIQSNNRRWIIIIIYKNEKNKTISSFLIIQK